MFIIKPLSWLFRCVGIAPSISSTDKYFSLALISVSTLVGVSYFSDVANDLDGLDSMYTLLQTLGRGSVLVAINGFIVYNILYRENYASILRDLQETENSLLAVGAKPYVPVSMQYVSFCVVPLWAVIRIVGCALKYESVFDTAIEVLIATTIVTSTLQHLVLVRQLHIMFSALNTLLSQFSSAADDTPVEVMSTQLHSVFHIHTSLHAIVCDINGHFFIFNFLNVSSRLMFCVTNMFDYLKSVSEDTPLHFTDFSVWSISIILVIIQCVICHACAKEANRTVLLAHHVLQPHTPHRLWMEVGDFSRLCIDDKVQFTVGGVFTLERPLITKIFVLALSYLIVALQLQDVQLIAENNLTSTIETTANSTYFENFTAFPSNTDKQ